MYVQVYQYTLYPVAAIAILQYRYPLLRTGMGTVGKLQPSSKMPWNGFPPSPSPPCVGQGGTGIAILQSTIQLLYCNTALLVLAVHVYYITCSTRVHCTLCTRVRSSWYQVEPECQPWHGGLGNWVCFLLVMSCNGTLVLGLSNVCPATTHHYLVAQNAEKKQKETSGTRTVLK